MSADQIAGYELGDVLGRGGMGVVYRATTPDGLMVAMKLMRAELANNELFRTRFLREMQFLRELAHPHVIPIYEAGEVGDRLFIAMKLVEGPDLKTLVGQRGRLTPEETLAISNQVASALDAAHENGIVHRDVKPHNILLDDSDQAGMHAYLTDFGLVKQLSAESSVSRAGELLGSVQYMPPEHIEGGRSDGRADVYSLACVVFECLTGRVPYPRETEVATMWAHVQEEPPRVERYRSNLAGGVSDVIARALAKDPSDRFLTCGEFIEDLGESLGKKKVHYSHPRRLTIARRRARHVWSPNFFPELDITRRRTSGVTVGLVASALLAVVVATLARQTPLGDRIVDAAGEVRDSMPVFSEKEPQDDDDRRRPRAGTESSPYNPPKPFNRMRGARSISAGRATPAPRTDRVAPKTFLPAASGPRESPVENGLLVFDRDMGGRSDIFIARPDGASVQNLTPNRPDGDSTPAWSPSGETIAFTSNAFDGNNYDLLLMGADGSDIVRFRTGPGYDTNPSWAPSGDRIAYDNRADQGPIDYTQAGAFTGDYEIRILELSTGRIERIAKGFNPTWSPDGKLIAFVRDSDLYAIRPDGTGLRRLTATNAVEESPDWSPDGRSLVYVRDGQLHVISRSGEQVAELHTGVGDAYKLQPAWSPDGRWIVFGVLREGERNELWVMKLGGTEARYVTEGRGFVDWQPRRME